MPVVPLQEIKICSYSMKAKEERKLENKNSCGRKRKRSFGLYSNNVMDELQRYT